MTKKTTEILPCTTSLCEVCKQIYEKKDEGVNSLQTLNPYGTHKKHYVKLNWPDDAVAGADIKNEIKIVKAKIFLHLLNNPKSTFFEEFLNSAPLSR